MIRISECLIVCIDISENDESALTVLKRGKEGYKQVNALYGNKAEELYAKLCGAKDLLKSGSER